MSHVYLMFLNLITVTIWGERWARGLVSGWVHGWIGEQMSGLVGK